jgi:hypothetical protein
MEMSLDEARDDGPTSNIVDLRARGQIPITARVKIRDSPVFDDQCHLGQWSGTRTIDYRCVRQRQQRWACLLCRCVWRQ